MSWKSIVITGLLCVVASPVLAAPTVSASLLGLDTAGNWVWEVSVDPDDTLFTNPANDSPDRGNGGSVSLEVGVSATGRGVVSAAPNLTNFPVPAPAGQPFGNAPAGWGTDIDGDTVRDEGVRFNVATDRVVAFLGSDFFGSINFGASNGAPKAAFRVHTDRPTSSSLTTTLNFLGAYNANSPSPRPRRRLSQVTQILTASSTSVTWVLSPRSTIRPTFRAVRIRPAVGRTVISPATVS
jgi:hypothetical protein